MIKAIIQGVLEGFEDSDYVIRDVKTADLLTELSASLECGDNVGFATAELMISAAKGSKAMLDEYKAKYPDGDRDIWEYFGPYLLGHIERSIGKKAHTEICEALGARHMISGVCPVFQDSACEVKSPECGK